MSERWTRQHALTCRGCGHAYRLTVTLGATLPAWQAFALPCPACGQVTRLPTAAEVLTWAIERPLWEVS